MLGITTQKLAYSVGKSIEGLDIIDVPGWYKFCTEEKCLFDYIEEKFQGHLSLLLLIDIQAGIEVNQGIGHLECTTTAIFR